MKKPQISIESFHKLSRTKKLTQFLYLDLTQNGMNELQKCYIPILFKYIHEDNASIFNELKALGLCDEWTKKKNKEQSQ
ncbi:Derepression protein [Providencia alcalifaciens]|uniref:Derepression protein n=1 Tax=Providencia alcalifaciens TaxID=126385 RepID=UPI003D95F717